MVGLGETTASDMRSDANSSSPCFVLMFRETFHSMVHKYAFREGYRLRYNLVTILSEWSTGTD
jgi:hypothetical protein